MKIFIIFILVITNLKFQDTLMFYDQTVKKNIKQYSQAYDIMTTDESIDTENNEQLRILKLDQTQESTFFDNTNSNLQLKDFLWEAKLFNLFIFPVKDQFKQNYKIKIEQNTYEQLQNAIQQDIEIENLDGEIQLEKQQDLDNIFKSIFFPQKTLQEDLNLEIQMLNGILMKRILNIVIFLSGNYDNIEQYQIRNHQQIDIVNSIYQLGLDCIKQQNNNYKYDPMQYLQFIFKQSNQIDDQFDPSQIKNQFAGYQNFKTDPWVILNLNPQQLTLANGRMIELTDEYDISIGTDNDKMYIKFEIDFENGFKFFSKPLDFIGSFLEKLESFYQDQIIKLREEGQKEDELNADQQDLGSQLKQFFVDSNPKDLYFEIYCNYFTEFILKLYERTVLKYTAQAVPFQYYKDQYYQKFQDEKINFEKKTNPINHSYFQFNILSQIFQFIIELQGLNLQEYFECLDLNIDEKNGTRNKCNFFQKELIDYFTQNKSNIITIKDLKNLAFGNYDQSFQYYLRIIKQFIQGHFNLTFKKYIIKTDQQIENNIQQLIIQKLSFAKKRILI